MLDRRDGATERTLIDLLVNDFSPQSVYERSDVATRSEEGLPESRPSLWERGSRLVLRWRNTVAVSEWMSKRGKKLAFTWIRGRIVSP